VAIFWKGDVVARLGRGRSALEPRITLHRTLDVLPIPLRQGIEARLMAWLETMVARALPGLVALTRAARDPKATAAQRALYAPLSQALGVVPRRQIDEVLNGLEKQERATAYRLGIRIGSLDLFMPALLKPDALRWRMALMAARADGAVTALPPAGAVTVMRPQDIETAQAWAAAGYRPMDRQMVRVDMAERLARILHEARIKANAAHAPFAPDAAMATSFGLHPESFARLLGDVGFRRQGEAWVWRGIGARRGPKRQPETVPGNAFGELAILRGKGG